MRIIPVWKSLCLSLAVLSLAQCSTITNPLSDTLLHKHIKPPPSPVPTATANSTPTPTITNIPTPIPTTSLTDTLYTQIINPGPWPANFRPYCANGNSSNPCPWNDKLPDNPQQIVINSSTIVAQYFSIYDIVALPGDWSLGGDYGHPTYLANTSDPLITVNCTSYCGLSTVTINIPSVARPAGGNDHHMAIIEPDGDEYDMYGSTYNGTSPTTASALYKTSVLGNGVVIPGGADDTGALLAGTIRADELSRGVIPHALWAALPCVSTAVVYPAGSSGSPCASGGAAMGSRWQLTLTDSQIQAMGLPVWESAILTAMHDYGIIIGDTSGDPSEPIGFHFESVTQYSVYGQSYPYASMGLDIAGFDHLIDWSHSFRIVDPCYSLETCNQ